MTGIPRSGPSLPSGLGWTAILAAHHRATESASADPMFSDPLAAAFVAAARRAGVDPVERPGLPGPGPGPGDEPSQLGDFFRYPVVERTPFFDEQVATAVTAGCRQLVILGAGLDTRAFRLGLPRHVTVYEVDSEPVHRFKNAVVSQVDARPTCARVTVVADVTSDWAPLLLAAGHRPDQRTVWLAEGLLFYTEREQADRLMDAVGNLSAPGSRFVGEYLGGRWDDVAFGYADFGPDQRRTWDMVRAHMVYGPVDTDPEGWLTSHCWTPELVTTLVRFGARTGRAAPPVFDSADAPPYWLFSGSRPA